MALWPALWAGPLRAIEQVRVGVVAEGAEPHMQGNFFLGRADDSPGLLFYPPALALRLTPWTLLGLLLLPIAWRPKAIVSAQQQTDREQADASRRSLVALAGFVILFVVAMSIFPKKFDRYLVPVFPVLDVLAAAGLLGVGYWVLGIGYWGLGVGKSLRRKSLVPSGVERAVVGRQSSVVMGLVGVITIAALANMGSVASLQH